MIAADPYGSLFRGALWPAWEGGLRGRPTLPLWREAERRQWWSRERLQAFQLRELRALLAHAAARVPYYRALLAEAALDPAQITSVADLARLPRLTKTLVREHYDALVDPLTAATHVKKKTSGSSGKPFAFEYDQQSEAWRQAIRLRGWGWAGYRAGARTLYYWGAPVALHGVSGVKTRVDRAIRRETYLDCLAQDDASLARAARVITETEPTCIVTWPIAMAGLARFVTAHRLRTWGTIPVVCGAEALTARDRESIERAFGAAVYETYGARETMLLAAECERHDGLHTMDDAQVVEVVKDGRPALPGEVGEVLVTDLHNLGMPLIRYENGDLAMAGPEEPCACGRSLGRIARVMGRQSDTLRGARGEPVPGILVHALVATHDQLVLDYQLVQRASGEVVLRVVPSSDADGPGVERIAADVARYLGGLPVRVERVASIERGPGGKHRSVIVEPAG